MRSERSPLPISDLRVAASLAWRSRICLSLMRAASTDSACALFLCCERSSWHSTTMPVGRCVMRTAESVLLMCWPPAPEARKVSMRSSAGLSTTSPISSASGMTATVQALVWMRPCVSVAGTRCTRWPPDSNLRRRIGALADDLGDDFLVAADFARSSAIRLRPASPGARHSASTCGTDRRRTARIRRRRCRRGFRGRCCARRSGRSAAAGAAARLRCRTSFCLPSRISASASSLISGSDDHLLRRLHVVLGGTIRAVQLDHRRDLGVLARELAIVVQVGRHALRRQQRD